MTQVSGPLTPDMPPVHDSEMLERAYAAAELCYGRGMSQKQAARELGTSPATLSRLLKTARDTGVVKISFHRPINVVLSHKLRQLLPQMRQIIVCGKSREDVANCAANWFHEQPQIRSIVLDGGRTLADFVEAVSFDRSRELTVLPLVADPPTYEQSASENAVRLAAKLSSNRSIRLPQFRGRFLNPLIQEARNVARAAEIVMISAGPFRETFTALDFTKHLGLDPEEIKREHPNAIASVGYNALDQLGNCLRIPVLTERLIYALDFDDLQQLALSEQCRVVLLAHSQDKAVAVEAALIARIFNCLIVDEPLAESLLNRLAER